jgi:hypothetical protein
MRMSKLPWTWIDHRIDPPAWITKYIGRIAVAWSDLEWQLEDAILLTMQTDIGRMVTTGISTRSRVSAVTNLVQSHVYYDTLDPSFLERTRNIGDTITGSLEADRNRIVHGLWGPHEGEWYLLRNSGTRAVAGLPAIKKLARAVLPQHEKFTPEKLGGILQRILQTRELMVDLCHDLERELPPSPHRSPRRIRQHRPSQVRKRKVGVSQP